MNNEELNQVPVQPAAPVAPVVPNPEPQVQPTAPVAPTPAPTPVVPAEPAAPVTETPVAPAPAPVPQTQINPTAVMADATEIPTVEAGSPAAPTAAAPIIAEVKPEATEAKVETVVEPIVTNSNEDISDVANTTFDYNALYGVQKTEEEIARDKQLDVVDKPMFTASEIEIASPTITNRTSEDVVPEFNINALDTNANTNTKTTDSSMSDDEKDKAESRRAITWLLVLGLLMIVFLVGVLPIITK